MEEKRIKIMVDAAVPFIQGVFEPYAEVVYKAGKQISREDLADVDAMVMRTFSRGRL